MASESSGGYPARPKVFALSFARLITKRCVANELGPQACWLLTVIAATEDARGYAGAVNFYNEQLLPLVGLASVDALDRVRKKCIEAGWLHYVPGGRRSGPGRYWVTVPTKFAGTDDAPTDEPEEPSNDNTLFRNGAEQNTEQTAEQSPSKARSKPRAKLGTSFPVPVPVSSAADSTSATTTIEPLPTKHTTPPSEKEPRPRNAMFDAVAEVSGLDPKTAGSHLGKVAATLTGAGYTAEEVYSLGRRFFQICPHARAENRRPYPGEIQKYIGRLRADGQVPSAASSTIPSMSEVRKSEQATEGVIYPHPRSLANGTR